MIRVVFGLIGTICLGYTARAGARPESLEELTYNGNIVLNEELDGKAFLNRRPIVRIERASTCVSAVWTQSGGAGSPLRRDLLDWNRMIDGEPHYDAQFYHLAFVYADHRRDDVVSIPLTEHPEGFEDSASVNLFSCQPKQHRRR